jgi:hypothetical protein
LSFFFSFGFSLVKWLFSKKLLPHTCELKGKKGSTGRKHVSKAPPTLFTLEDRLFNEVFWIIPKDFIFVDVFFGFSWGILPTPA